VDVVIGGGGGAWVAAGALDLGAGGGAGDEEVVGLEGGAPPALIGTGAGVDESTLDEEVVAEEVEVEDVLVLEDEGGVLQRLTARLRGVTLTTGAGSIGEVAATRAARARCM
jgi:hypothetical protein